MQHSSRGGGGGTVNAPGCSIVYFICRSILPQAPAWMATCTRWWSSSFNRVISFDGSSLKSQDPQCSVDSSNRYLHINIANRDSKSSSAITQTQYSQLQLLW